MLNFFINTAHAGVWDPIIFKSSVGLDISLCPARPDGTFLACYISSLYTFFVQAAIILAVFMIMMGGFQWMMAVGDSGKISNAKSTITEAIWGLVLALISYVLFAQINSNLVNLQNLDIQPVNITPKTNLLTAPTGFCGTAVDVPSLSRFYTGEISSQQLRTFHPSLVLAMNKLNALMEQSGYKADLNSVTDDYIWQAPNNEPPCVREKAGGVLSGTCQHAGGGTGSSYHYGPIHQDACAFNSQYPPASCAVDIGSPSTLTSLSGQFWVSMMSLMQQAGFQGLQCERKGSSDSYPCGLPGVNHIHGELVSADPQNGTPFCYSVISQVGQENNPSTPAAPNPN